MPAALTSCKTRSARDGLRDLATILRKQGDAQTATDLGECRTGQPDRDMAHGKR